MSEILIDHVLLDRVTKDAKESPRLRMNYNFHESLSSPSQRLLNALEPGTVLPIHRHRHTAETYVLLRGRMRVLFYDDDKKEINRYELDPAEGTYGVNIPRGQWHNAPKFIHSLIIRFFLICITIVSQLCKNRKELDIFCSIKCVL